MGMAAGAEGSAANSIRPHCTSHPAFAEGCPVCQRALANSLPYKGKQSAPVTRSYGFTDDLTEAKIRAISPSWSSYLLRRAEQDEEAPSLSLRALRLILRLIWPFSRII